MNQLNFRFASEIVQSRDLVWIALLLFLAEVMWQIMDSPGSIYHL